MLNKCKVCNKKNFEIVWNDKIRSGKNNFTKKNSTSTWINDHKNDPYVKKA